MNYQPRRVATCAKAHQKEFEELTGIDVGFEQIPEQQQRPKVAMEMASGHPSFDVVNVAMHVQKRLIEKRQVDGGSAPLHRRPSLTAPDLDMADFSQPSMQVATGADGKINVLPMNQDLFILYYNKEMFAQKGFMPRRRRYDETDGDGARSSPTRARASTASSAAA